MRDEKKNPVVNPRLPEVETKVDETVTESQAPKSGRIRTGIRAGLVSNPPTE